MPVAAIAGPLIGAGVGLLGSKKTADATKSAAAATATNPYDVSSPFGGVQYDRNTRQMSVNPSNSPFGSLANALGTSQLANFGFGQSNPYASLTPDVLQAAGNYGGLLEGQAAGYNQLGGGFADALQQLGTDPQAAAQNRYNLLTQAAMPEQNRMFNTLQDRLFGRGQLGTSGGAEQNRAFYESANQADLQRQLAGQNFGMQQQNQLANLAGQFGGLGQNAAQSRFALAQNLLGAGDTRNQNMLGQAGQLQGLYQQQFNPLLQFAQLGVGAGGGQQGQAALGAMQGQQNYYNALGGVAQQGINTLGNYFNPQPPSSIDMANLSQGALQEQGWGG